MHVEANPVFTDFDIRTGITQLRQNSIQCVWLRITADNFAARNRRRHQERPGFNTVWQNAIHTTAETFNAFNGDTIGTLPGDLRTQRNQEISGIHNFRFTGGVFDDGGTFCKRCRAHDSDRRADTHFVHDNVCAFQTSLNGRLHIAFFQLDGGT